MDEHLGGGGIGGDGDVVLVAQIDDVVQVLFQLIGVGVVEEQHHVDLVIGDAGADLLAAALGVGQEQLHRQAGGLGNLLAGIAGGADGVLGENAAVGNAELDHELLFVVVAHQSDVHMTPSFLGGIGRACFPLRFEIVLLGKSILSQRIRSRGTRWPKIRLAMLRYAGAAPL